MTNHIEMFEHDQPKYDRSKMKPLWPHQEKGKDMLRTSFAQKHTRNLVSAPTGSGKTIMAFDWVHSALDRGRRVAFVADRRQLVEQTSVNATKAGLGDHGVIMGNSPARPWLPFQIISAQTWVKRGHPGEPFDLYILDECHAVHKKIVQDIILFGKPTIGLTATPYTEGLGKIYSNIVNPTTLHELTENGVLVPAKIFACKPMDMSDAEMKNGEWTDRGRERASMRIIGDVVESWHEHAQGLKTILFASTKNECAAYCEAFNRVGVLSAIYISDTTSEERKDILDEFEKPDSAIKILCSVGCLTRGFDVPDIMCGIDVRPLSMSLTEEMQKIGRVLRSAPGKSFAIWLCHAGNIARFKEDIEDAYFNGCTSLDDGEKKDKVIRAKNKDPAGECPACGYVPFYKRCMRCGHERKAKALTEIVPGKMVEIKFGNKVAARDEIELWEMLCHRSREETWLDPAKEKGRAWARFLAMTGKNPPKNMPFEKTRGKPASKALINEIARQASAYREERRRQALQAYNPGRP